MTAARSICLITPGHVSGNPRIVKEAEALSDAGHSVTVIAARYLEWGDREDKAFANRRWRLLRPVSFGPRAPRPVYLRQTALRRAARLACRVPIMPLGAAACAQHPAAADLRKAACSVRADLYIAHYIAALPAAAAAARQHGSLYGFDAEDFHPGDLPDSLEHRFEKQLIDRIERGLLPGAAHVTAASPGIAQAYAATYGLPAPQVVLNVFPAGSADGPAPADERVQSPSVYWFSQTIGPGRGLECAVEAVGLAQSKPHLYLRGTVQEAYARHLRALAERHGASSRLHFLATCPPAELERRGRAFDLGYAGETGFSRNNGLALANKLFSYLCSGLGILMSATPAHRDIFPELGGCAALFEIDDARSLASAMDRFLGEPAHLRAARAAAIEQARSRFNWETESRKLVAAVERALEAAP